MYLFGGAANHFNVIPVGYDCRKVDILELTNGYFRTCVNFKLAVVKCCFIVLNVMQHTATIVLLQGQYVHYIVHLHNIEDDNVLSNNELSTVALYYFNSSSCSSCMHVMWGNNILLDAAHRVMHILGETSFLIN